MKQWHPWLLALSAVFVATSAQAAGDIPQMDPSWYPNQLLWLAISFALLFLVVSRFIAPGIRSVLEVRETAIAEAIREAERARHEAESSLMDGDSATRTARAKAAEIMAKMQSEANAEAAKAIAKREHDLARKADHAEAVLADALRKASAEIDSAALDLAQAMVQKVSAATSSKPTVQS